MMNEINEYMTPPGPTVEPVTVTKGNKKRKKPSTDDLKQKARFHCKCPEQWKPVSKYNAKRMTEFVEESEFNSLWRRQTLTNS